MSESKGKKINALAHNLRFLRKKMGISQDEMARRLGIKRSNIAAYEIKNVEPRLRVIMELSDFFKIDLINLIKTPLNEDNFKQLQKQSNQSTEEQPQEIFHLDQRKEIQKFKEKSRKIRQILNGFKAFYSFKKDKFSDNDPQKQKLLFDIENFLQLTDHLLSHNEELIKAISNQDHQ
jgi:transcriptional regulator with XRE-family HTH domain